MATGPFRFTAKGCRMKFLEGNGFLLVLVLLLAFGIVGYLLHNATVLILLLVAVVVLILAKVAVRPRPNKKG